MAEEVPFHHWGKQLLMGMGISSNTVDFNEKAVQLQFQNTIFQEYPKKMAAMDRKTDFSEGKSSFHHPCFQL
jgi:hypothetical protein